MRRISTCLAVLGLAVLGLSASASAAPTITFKAKAVPIPGVPGTGEVAVRRRPGAGNPQLGGRRPRSGRRVHHPCGRDAGEHEAEAGGQAPRGQPGSTVNRGRWGFVGTARTAWHGAAQA